MGEQGKSSRYFLLSIVLVGAVSFHSLTLMRFPRPFVDEVWNLARASGFLESGWAFGPLDEGVFEEFPGHKRFFPWLPTAIQSLVYWWSDTPALGPLRVISLIAGFVVLGAIWKIAFDLKGFEVATLALWLTAFSFSFGVSTHLGRFDIFTAAFGYWAVALKLASPSTLARNFCSGLLSGLAVECHAHGAVFPFALLLFVALKDKASCLRDPTFWAFISGGIVTVVIYIGVHIGPYLDSYVAWNRLVFAPTHCHLS